MNAQRRREIKQRKAQRTKKTKLRKKKNEDTVKFLKSAAVTLLIWGLVIVNLFLIASFVSKFWRAPGGNETTITTHKNGSPELPVTPRIKVEVLNGCGVPGVAKQITNFLRDKGFDVVKTDNYESFNIRETTVIDRASLDKVNAIEVAKALGVNLEKGVAPFLSQDLLLEVSVIIGHDYQYLNAFKETK